MSILPGLRSLRSLCAAESDRKSELQNCSILSCGSVVMLRSVLCCVESCGYVYKICYEIWQIGEIIAVRVWNHPRSGDDLMCQEEIMFINFRIKLVKSHSLCKIKYKTLFPTRFFKRIHQKKWKQSVRATAKISRIPKLGISAKQQARSEARKIWQPNCSTTVINKARISRYRDDLGSSISSLTSTSIRV